MNQIEITTLIAQLFHHQKVLENRVTLASAQTQGLCGAGDELSAGLRVARGEQGDLVTLVDELFRQIRDYAFGAAIKLGRNTFDEGSDLSYFHENTTIFLILQPNLQRALMVPFFGPPPTMRVPR